MKILCYSYASRQVWYKELDGGMRKIEQPDVSKLRFVKRETKGTKGLLEISEWKELR